MIEEIDNLIKRNNFEKFFTKKYFNYFIIGCFGILGLSLDWNINILIVVLALTWQILFPIEGQFLAKLAVFCLLLTLIMLAIGKNSKATIFSELAYLLLIVSVIMTVFFDRRSGKE